MFNRFKIIQLHMLIASFLLPLAALYFISGALYTLGIKGSVAKQTFEVALAKPFEPNLELLTAVAGQALVERALPIPGGEPGLKKKKGVYTFRWDGLRYSLTMVEGKSGGSVVLTYRERSLLTQLMRIHRGEAGALFKFLSIAAVAGLLFVFASGLYLAYTVTKFRRPSLIAMALGAVVLMVFMAA